MQGTEIEGLCQHPQFIVKVNPQYGDNWDLADEVWEFIMNSPELENWRSVSDTIKLFLDREVDEYPYGTVKVPEEVKEVRTGNPNAPTDLTFWMAD